MLNNYNIWWAIDTKLVLDEKATSRQAQLAVWILANNPFGAI